MVLPFGVGIGDVIQVANLTKTVVSELKKLRYFEAEPKIRRTLCSFHNKYLIKTADWRCCSRFPNPVTDLENLERILSQINKLEPAEHDLAQLEPIRATIKACQLPLRSFLEKISKFEESLGVRTSKGRSLNGIGRRIQWKLAYKSDVTELRATLAGHVNVLTLHIGLQALKNALTAETDRAGNFQTLLSAIEAQRPILESLDRRQLGDPNNSFNVETAINALIDRLDRSTTSQANMQTNLDDQAQVLQSIQLANSEILRNLQSELEHMKQHGASNLVTHAESDPGETVFPGPPSLTLTTALKTLTAFLASIKAFLAKGSAIRPTGMSHAAVGPLFEPSVTNFDARPLESRSSRMNVDQNPEGGQDSPFLDLYPYKRPNLSYVSQRMLKEDPSASSLLDDGIPYDMLQDYKTDKDEFKSSEVTPVRSREALGCHLPPLLSFIVEIEPLSPNYGNEGQSPRRTREGYFLPPKKRNGFKKGDGSALLLRWMGGRFSPVAADDPIHCVRLGHYRTATVFTQNEDTPHLLAVPFDARERHVRDAPNDWRTLTFNHERISGTDSYYTYISCIGAETGVAARGSAHWMPQLVPGWYQYRPRTQQTRSQAGLVGELPLLIALAAFSAPPTAPGVLLTSVQPGAWNPHAHPYPSGHTPERGMVVTVSLDPRHPAHSTKESLDKLQNGVYGPFYGPKRPPQPSSMALSTRTKQFKTASYGAGRRY